MSTSFTFTDEITFTVVHARHMAAKVATDLKRLQRFYGKPGNQLIADFEVELIALLKGGYLGEVTYGFQRDGEWIEPTLRYTAQDLVGDDLDDSPGRIRPRADIEDASFRSFLVYSEKWDDLTPDEQEAFKQNLPFYRGYGSEPSINGYLDDDKTYSAGGRALSRASVRSY